MNKIKFISVLTTLLNSLGCLGQAKKDENKLSNGVTFEFTKLIEEFNSRPIYTYLTKKNIDTTSDDNLLQIVFDNLQQKQPTDFEKEYEIVMSWNKPRQAIYMIWLLEAEVNNGGFNQYYFNSSRKFYKHLPEMLKLVGANKFAELTQRANITFEKENEKITQHQDGTTEGFSKSYDDNPLNIFDNEFYELYKIENLQQIQVDFIRKNKKEFIDKL